MAVLANTDFYRQDNAGKTLLLACPEKGAPELVYFGNVLPVDTDASHLYLALQAGVPQAMLEHPPRLSLLPEAGRGWLQSPAVEVNAVDRPAWSVVWLLQNVIQDDNGLQINLCDPVAELSISLNIALLNSGVLSQKITLTNIGKEAVEVQRLACTLPVPEHFTERMGFYGRWCQEFQQERSTWQTTWLQENRHGRNSHGNFPSIIVGQEGFGEQHGDVIGAHFAWSGNHRLKADYTINGDRYLQAEVLYLPGELSLASGETIETPELLACVSTQGLNLMSQAFHDEARARLKLTKPRPVHLNTWEAFYFDHDMDQLKALADAAAEVGVERYILDDGWFKGRDHEQAALGDWYVDTKKYPNGLMPLIQHVKDLGMEFGLWFEPEMVNPDSDLFRNHPEWALQLPQYEAVLGRYQHILNLAHPDAYAYIRERLFSLLEEYPIDYIKWDMNRDYTQPGGELRPEAYLQVQALYRLFGELNAAFPGVEIESCSSGGARVDFGILNYTKRFWASDCNDALERHSIQRGFSYFFPPEVMGSHIGPDKSHTTSRVHDVVFRAGTAMLGHLGIEWNLLDANEEQKATVKRWLSHYKQQRNIMHTGRNWRLPSADGRSQTQWALSDDGLSGFAVYAQLTVPKQAHPLPMRLPNLIADQLYRVEVLESSEIGSHLMKTCPAWWNKELILNGATLSQIGLKLPILDPEALILIAVTAVTTTEIN